MTPSRKSTFFARANPRVIFLSRPPVDFGPYGIFSLAREGVVTRARPVAARDVGVLLRDADPRRQ